MAANLNSGLLEACDPAPVEVVNPNGRSPVLLTCEHAGRAIPRLLGNLGVAPGVLDRHIAYDIGAEKLARQMSKELDATLVLQSFSRLVIDCNRPFNANDCIPAVSDGSVIPANAELSQAAKQQRIDEIHKPFHDTVKSLLDQHEHSQKAMALSSVHSFTPKLQLSEITRPWHVGLLHGHDDNYAREIQVELQHIDSHINVALNEPYSIDQASDYTIPVHADQRGMPHVLLEIRNDELATPAQIQRWSELLSRALMTAFNRIEVSR